MAKFNNFGGGGFGGGNMQMLMKQAQKMQEDMKNAQSEIDETEIEGTSGGGLVRVVINGNKKPLSINIDSQAMDDAEMLEDLLLVALGEASDKADRLREEKMGKFGGGLF